MSPNRPGRILTFYSYKGGTGRSMALANIAWILAASGRRVLMIDWDLEAPGLHRYFRPFLIDEELVASDGLMDLVDNYANQAIQPVDASAPPDPNWYLEYADFTEYVISINFDRFPNGGKIDLLPAGRQNDRYAITVSSFNWQNFYDRLGGGGFFEAVKAKARANYDYILIDSRTGVSDTAGICSVQMPDSLIVCFTYNNQSIKGAAAIARSAKSRRSLLDEEKRASRLVAHAQGDTAIVEDTPEPYRIYPVPMRVESGESERLAIRQAFARQQFAGLMDHVGPAAITEYWGGVEIPHKAFYSYEEVLAAFKDDALDPKTVLSAFVRVTRQITDRDVDGFRQALNPEEAQALLRAFAATSQVETPSGATRLESPEETLTRLADTAVASLNEAERQLARRVFGRLVGLGRDEDGGGYFPIRVATRELSSAEASLVVKLANHGLVSISTERPRSSRSPNASGSLQPPEQTVGIADERLLRTWHTLLDWLDADREFLLWRQRLRTYLSDWERSGRSDTALMSGPILREAEHWLFKRPADLNVAETAYISDSSRTFGAPEPTHVGLRTGDTQETVRYPEATVRYPVPAGSALDKAMSAGPTSRASSPAVWIGAAVVLLVALVAGAMWVAGRGRPNAPAGSGPVTTTPGGTPSATQAATPAVTPTTTVLVTPPPAPIASERIPPPVDRARLEALVAQGDGYYAAGNIVMARDAYAKALDLDAASPAASSGLRRVNEGDQSTSGRIIIRYANREDVERVKELTVALTVNLRPLEVGVAQFAASRTLGEVRYFFPQDERLALRVKRATEFALLKKDLRLPLSVVRREANELPRTMRAMQGTIEVWLPALTRARPTAY